MIHVDLSFVDHQQEPIWPDLHDPIIVEGPVAVAGLAGGMRSGRPSVAMRFQLPDGREVVAETSLRLFLVAADALRARFGSGGE